MSGWIGQPPSPCATCGTAVPGRLPPAPGVIPPAPRCDACWETEHRLAEYLRRGGENARRFVEEKLREAQR